MHAQVRNPKEAQDVILKKIKAGYGHKVRVYFLRTNLETDLADGRKFWVVEGKIKVKRLLFLEKSWHFTYFVSAEDGRILIMRGKRAK